VSIGKDGAGSGVIHGRDLANAMRVCRVGLRGFLSKRSYIPTGDLILDSAGNIYGTTQAGGAQGSGIVFEIMH
jgi:hypothetical protein